jgi:DNA-binding LytR/AlgR family response regulator
MTDRQYTCLIVDDEPPAREVLRRYISQLPVLRIAGECANAVQAMIILKQQPIDLLFLDIQMPRISGIEMLKTMPVLPKVILTTAFEQYALQAFDLDVTDYLLKPVSFERFLKAVMKALPAQESSANGPAVSDDATPESPFLYFRAERKMVKVFLDQILYIESLKDYVRIHTTTGELITKHSMAALEAVLPEARFIRIHRSFIVATDRILSFTAERICIKDTQLPIGKLYRLQVLKRLQG